MTARRIAAWFSACFLVAATAQGQFAVAPDAYCDTCCDHDAQLFAPVDFDFDCQPIRQDCGYFFNFDKLSWAFTGERTRLGVEDPYTGSFNPYRVFRTGSAYQQDPDDDEIIIIIDVGDQVIINPPALLGTIDDAGIRANFAWGERYEFGKFDGDNGWLVGVLDGPEAHANNVFGFGLTGQDNTVTDGGLGLPSPFPNAPNQLLSPFGSVIINFDDPLGLMLGYIDVVDGAVQGAGPVPGNILPNDSNGDGVLDGDGIADDIDRDSQFGPDGFAFDDPWEVPDRGGVGGNNPAREADFDDLVLLPTSWQTVTVRNSTEVKGIEIMRTHRFSNAHMMQKHQNNEVSINYGVRYLKLRDDFNVAGFGGVLGDSFWDTRFDNNIVGPQVALNWTHVRHRLRFDWNGRCLLGYNVANFSQTAALGEDLVYAQHNHPLYFQPTYATHGRREEEFSPVAEMRVQGAYQITGALAVKLGYTAMFVDNIRRSAQHVRYELPRMGYQDGGTQDIFINGVNFGFEAVY